MFLADFQSLVAGIASAALATDGSLEAIGAAKLKDGATVDEALKSAIATIGENMTLRRSAMIAARSPTEGSDPSSSPISAVVSESASGASAIVWVPCTRVSAPSYSGR